MPVEKKANFSRQRRSRRCASVVMAMPAATIPSFTTGKSQPKACPITNRRISGSSFNPRNDHLPLDALRVSFGALSESQTVLDDDLAGQNTDHAKAAGTT